MPKAPRPSAHVANILSATKDHHPNFTLLLGAGASVESGVPTAGKLIEKWRETFVSLHGCGEPGTQVLEKQDWYEKPTEYSRLFETLYDQPSQRREVVENIVTGASPSWGYMYLVNLLQRNVFNTVFTTNFDDLLNEACYQFSADVRPLVCAHDSSIRSVRVTSKRPKIIKLHGDFLFDSIKNTERELESLETNMRNKFRQFATEYGMIVIGYAGRDRSVMDTLDSLLRSEENFPHGIYWCVTDDKSIPEEVDSLCRFARFQLVRIPGFDAFMAELHDAVGVGLHPVVEQPFSVVAARFGALIRNLRVPADGSRLHSTLERDAARLGDKLVTENAQQLTSELPFRLLAYNARKNGDLVTARARATQQLKATGHCTEEDLMLAVTLLLEEWDGDLFQATLSATAKFIEHSARPGVVLNMSMRLIAGQLYDAAQSLLEATSQYAHMAPPWWAEYHFLNEAQIKAHKKNDFSQVEVDKLKRISEQGNTTLGRFGALCALGEVKRAEQLLFDSVRNGIVDNTPMSDIASWPITKLLPKDAYERLFQNASEPGNRTAQKKVRKRTKVAAKKKAAK